MKVTTATAAVAVAAAGAVADTSLPMWYSWTSTSTGVQPASTTSTSTTSSSTSTWAQWSSSSKASPSSVYPTSSSWAGWHGSSSVRPYSSTSSSYPGWSTWSSSTYPKPTTCPAVMNYIKTETSTVWEATTEVYKSTVTFTIPSTPASINIQPVWTAWAASTPVVALSSSSSWQNWQTCPTGTTTTSTVVAKATGTYTIYGSIIYVGVQETWVGWSAPANTPAATPLSPKPYPVAADSSSSWQNWQGSLVASVTGRPENVPVVTGGVLAGVAGPVSNAINIGNGGNAANGHLVYQTDAGVYQWHPQEASNTASGVAPTYTQASDGSWGGTPYGGVGGWNNWPAGGSSVSGAGTSTTGGASGAPTGSYTTGPGYNGTVVDPVGTSNGTQPNVTNICYEAGSPCSNVTAAFEPLAEPVPACNSPADRSSWCGGSSVGTNPYGSSGPGKRSLGSAHLTGETKSFDFVITQGPTNHEGKNVTSFLINGQSPGPVLEANWGDIISVTVTNSLPEDGTTIHWHGLRQVGTNDQDGVPGITECSIAPGSSRTYKFVASSYGTSWYHSHWGLQYGDGLYGPIVIHGPTTANYDVDAGPVILSETYGQLSAAQQGALVAHNGPENTYNYLMNGVNTSPDLSTGQHPLWIVKPGKKYLFRLINAASQNQYSVTIDKHTMQVVAADFVPIVPYTTDYIHVGSGQRYDVIVEMNQAVASYFFRAITLTECPSACVNSGLGQANGIIAYEGVSTTPLQLPTSTLNGNKQASDFFVCGDEPLSSLVPYVSLSADQSAFNAQLAEIDAGYVGPVNTPDDGTIYRWQINHGYIAVNYTQPTLMSLSQGRNFSDPAYSNGVVLTKQNQWYYFIIQNQFTVFHPMHLHGHDFAVLGSGIGVFDPKTMAGNLNFANPMRRDTVMLPGSDPNQPPSDSNRGGYTVIGFQTDNPGAWLMHCHIAWHVDNGLAMQFIEAPSALNYKMDSTFQSQCSAYAAYEVANPGSIPLSSSSGLRRRAAAEVDSHMKRGLGDGARRRTFGRRR